MFYVLPVILACYGGDDTNCVRFTGPQMTQSQCVKAGPMLIASFATQYPNMVVKTIKCEEIGRKTELT